MNELRHVPDRVKRELLQTLVLALLATFVCSRARAERGRWNARASYISVPYGLRIPDSYLFSRDLTRGERRKTRTDGRVLPHATHSVRFDPLAEVRDATRTSTPDPFRERGYTAYVGYMVSPMLELGLSGRATNAMADRLYMQRLATTHVGASVFARLRVARAFTIAGEVGALDTSRRELGYAAQLQLEATLMEGLRLLWTGQFVQRGARDDEANVGPSAADLQPGAWLTLDWLVCPHFETRLDAIKRDNSGTSLLARFTTYF